MSLLSTVHLLISMSYYSGAIITTYHVGCTTGLENNIARPVLVASVLWQ